MIHRISKIRRARGKMVLVSAVAGVAASLMSQRISQAQTAVSVAQANAGTFAAIETSGPYIKSYVALDGSSTSFPSFGLLQFNAGSFNFNGLQSVNSATLSVTELNYSKNSPAPINVYLVGDTTTAFSSETYTTASGNVGGFNPNGAFADFVGSINFSNTASKVDILSLQLTGSDLTYIDGQVAAGNPDLLRIVFTSTTASGTQEFSSALSSASLSINGNTTYIPKSLIYTGGVSNVWDTTTTNFTTGTGSTAFTSSDSVSFTNTGAGAVNIQSAGVLPSSTTFNNTTTYTLTGGPIASGSLGIAGGGLVVLSNTSNSYGGSTNISSGTLQITADNIIPVSTAVNLSAGGTLDLNGHTQTIGAINLSGGEVVTGSGTLLTSTINSSSMSTAAGVIAGNLNTGAASTGTTTFTANHASGLTTDLDIEATLSGSGRASFTGNGSILLNGSNAAFAGGIATSTGVTVVLGNTTALGSATPVLFLNGGGLFANVPLTGTSAIPNSVSVGGPLTFGGQNIELGVAGSGSFSYYRGGVATLTVNNNTTLTEPVADYGTSSYTSILQNGTGTLMLNSTSNTFTGSVTVDSGTVVVSPTSSIATAFSARLDATNGSPTMVLTSAGQLNSTGNAAQNEGLLVVTTSTTNTATLNITGAQSVFALLINGTSEMPGIYSASNEPADDASLIVGSGTLNVLSTVPEPTSMALLGIVFPGLLARRRRRSV